MQVPESNKKAQSSCKAVAAVVGSAVGGSPVEKAVAVVAIAPVCIPLRPEGGGAVHVGVRPAVLLRTCRTHHTLMRQAG